MTTTGNPENSGLRPMSRGRVAAWIAAALILLLPLIAMQFTDDVNWSVGDFLFAGLLLFGTLGAYEAVARATGDTWYRAGVGVALAAALLLAWGNAAVGLTDSEADGLYLGVIAVGLCGACIARFRPAGMARAMFATALAMTLVSVIALIAGVVPPYNSAFEILGITAFYTALWVGSAFLFKEAAQQQASAGTAL